LSAKNGDNVVKAEASECSSVTGKTGASPAVLEMDFVRAWAGWLPSAQICCRGQLAFQPALQTHVRV